MKKAFLICMIILFPIILLAQSGQSGDVLNQFNDMLAKANVKAKPSSVSISFKLAKLAQRIEYWKEYWNKNDLDVTEDDLKGIGSGVIISKDGYIVTNNHVINEADPDNIIVTTFDGTQYLAEVIGSDEITDLAVLRIYGDNFTPVEFANSDKILPGNWCIALGSPLGLSQTLTKGIVSAIGRTVLKSKNTKSDNKVAKAQNYIQTDAAINPRNSGGGLFDVYGKLIGINVAIYTYSDYFIGYGFAIPSNVVKKIAFDLMDDGNIDKPWLGITGVDTTIFNSRLTKEVKGVFCDFSEKNAPASIAGITKGDLIYEFDGSTVDNISMLQSQMALHITGDTIKLKAYRGDSTVSFNIELLADPYHINKEQKLSLKKAKLGFTVKLNKVNNAVINKVDKYSAAYNSGLKEGDVILKIDDALVPNVDSIIALLEKHQPGDKVTIEVKRNDKETKNIPTFLVSK